MKDKLALFLIVILCPIFIRAQKVSGILNGPSGKIQFANIILFNANDSSVVQSVISTENGSFSMKNNNKDSVFIQTLCTGFKVFSSIPFVGPKQFGEITLESDTDLDTLLISYKKPFKEISAHGTTFNIEGNKMLQTGTADRMIRKLPGVQIRQEKSISVYGKNNATIYINGKRSYLEEKNLIQYLQTIPADQILKVEVYDTPPAKFDSEGDGAIINIIMKKPPLGTFGNIYTDFGHGNYFKIGTLINVNHRTKKFNLYGGIRFRSYETANVTQDSTILDYSKSQYFFNKGNFNNESVLYNGKIGLDYYPNDKTTLGIYFDCNIKNEVNKHLTNGDIMVDVVNYNALKSEKISDNQNLIQNFNLDFNRNINDSVNFSSDIVFLRFNLEDVINTNNDLYQGNVIFDKTLINSKSKASINIFALKGDYSAQLKKKWKIDIGLKYSYIFDNNNFIAYSGTKPKDLILDTNVSNDFKYQESIAAGYLSIQKKWSGKFVTDIGGRVEQTKILGSSPAEYLKFTKKYFNFFPNISFVYNISKNHKFSLLYTERIERPNTTELNPFLRFINEFELESGNPNLNPVLDKLINFKYTFLEHATFVIEAGKKYDYYANVFNQDLTTGIKTWNPDNIGTGEYLNFNLGSPIPIADYWMCYIQLNYLYAQLNSPPNHYRINNFSSYIGNQITLPKNWEISISAWYSHNSFTDIWLMEPVYAGNLSVTKEIGKWNIGVEVYDFLNVENYKGKAVYNGLNLSGTFKGESRTIWLDIRYRFGNSKIEKKRERKVGEYENGRVN